MIDSVVDVIPGKRATGLKHLDNSDWFFSCHLINEQIMPGTLQVEAMLQTLIMTIYTMDGHDKHLSYVTESNCKFFGKVSPGDNLTIYSELTSRKRGVMKGVAEGKVNNKTVCKGSFKYYSPHEALSRF